MSCQYRGDKGVCFHSQKEKNNRLNERSECNRTAGGSSIREAHGSKWKLGSHEYPSGESRYTRM